MLMKSILVLLLLTIATVAHAIKPEREYKWTPDMRGLKYSEYQTRTIDDYSINVWEYALPDSVTSNRTVILVGTDAGNMSYLIWQANVFLNQGIRVIAFDYRGFGKSSDFTINKDFLFYSEFALDLDSVIKSTREKYPTDKIGLYALSMGTHISLLRKEKIDFLIAEGFFHDPFKVIDRIKAKGKSVLLPPEAKAISKPVQVPTLIFSADGDETTTTDDAREFSQTNTATLVEFSGKHLTGMNVLTKQDFGDEYMAKVMEFLNKSGV